MTTADKTTFRVEKYSIKDLDFYFDGNQKITADNGDFYHPQANAFSIWQGKDCPFRTPTCDSSCYVHNLEKHQPEVHKHYQINSENIRKVCEYNEHGMVDWALLDHVVEGFANYINTNCQGGFRWHVSGDIFSKNYAIFIRNVVKETPFVQHWIYTRSFHLLDEIVGLDNLTVNLSADKDNYWLARRLADEHELRVCYLTVDGEVPMDLHKGDVIFPDYGLRGIDQSPFFFRQDSKWWQGLTGEQKKMVCPVDQYGKSQNVRCGPCSRCLV